MVLYVSILESLITGFNRTVVMDVKDLNRIKVVLVEQKRTGVWLAEQLGVSPVTVSKWCSNTTQPGLKVLFQIAELLGVKYTELLRDPKEV